MRLTCLFSVYFYIWHVFVVCESAHIGGTKIKKNCLLIITTSRNLKKERKNSSKSIDRCEMGKECEWLGIKTIKSWAADIKLLLLMGE